MICPKCNGRKFLPNSYSYQPICDWCMGTGIADCCTAEIAIVIEKPTPQERGITNERPKRMDRTLLPKRTKKP